jgi:methionyl-tRNA synthetase
MIGKYFDGVVPADESGAVVADHDWRKLTADHIARGSSAIQQREVAEAIECGLALIRRIDGFLNATEPFKLAKDESKRGELAAILYQCAEALRIASLLLWPAMPEKIEALWAALGVPNREQIAIGVPLNVSIDPAAGGLEAQARWGGLTPGGRVQKVALFPRVEQALSPVGAA